MSERIEIKKHAIVIGASMAGLLTARVLSDHFEKVTILERDQLSRHSRTSSWCPPSPTCSCIAFGRLSSRERAVPRDL